MLIEDIVIWICVLILLVSVAVLAIYKWREDELYREYMRFRRSRKVVRK